MKNHKVGHDLIFTSRKSNSSMKTAVKYSYETHSSTGEMDRIMIILSAVALSFFVSQFFLIIAR